jgi:hypothetical protein
LSTTPMPPAPMATTTKATTLEGALPSKDVDLAVANHPVTADVAMAGEEVAGGTR